MKKMRVFELAAKLAIDAKDLLKIAKDLAISVENNMSMVDVHDIERIKKRLERESEKQHDEAKPEAFEEERVSSKVIRRRARPTTPAEAEASKEEEAPVKTAAPVEVEAEAPAVSAPSPKAAPAKERPLKAAPEIETAPAPVAPVVEPAPVVASEAAKAEPPKPATTAEEEEKKKKKAKKKGKVEAAAPEVVEEKPARAPIKKAPKFKEKEKEKEVFTQFEIYDDSKPSHGKRAFKGREKKPLAPLPVKKKIWIGRTITVLNLAREMRVKVSAVTRVLAGLGLSTSENQYLNSEEAILAAGEMGFEVEEARDDIKEDYINEPQYSPEDMSPRPPVVTIMGHVDHGKTSLLDAIRSENVTESEFGGITQHIGAYQAHLKDKTISFIDTPGHEAFTSMRARGAQVTDFVVLVVAADDGVMEQTKEAINHARAAQIPIIVAVNKIDKPNANPQRVKEQLSDLGLLPEAWGGDTIFVEVSAKKHTGIEELLEMILLQAEMLDLKAVAKGPARGAVLESKLDKSRGPMSTMLIQSGELKQGDIFVVGNTWGRVRAMFDFRGNPISKALPATPVEIIGLTTPPMAGDRFFVVPNEKKAREIVDYLAQEARHVTTVEPKAQVTLEDLYSQVMEGRLKALNLIIKGDVHGTVEAIVGVVKGLETGEGIRVNVVHYAVGGITENDILLASTTQAVIVGFNVKPDPKSKVVAKHYGIDIKLYTVIYDLIDDIKQSLAGMLEPVYEDVLQGKAEIRSVFKISKIGTIAGCMVLEGKITRNADAKLIRAGDLVYEGKIGSLKRFKDDVREVVGGYECGIGLDGYNDLKEGDIVEVYTKEKATP
ncbi:MAG: translation initiation factor IF-2 [Syntrophaceae bacterium]